MQNKEPKEQPALYVDPKLAMEIMQNLKTACPNQYKGTVSEAIGSLTQRDLILYSLGRVAGITEALASFSSAFVHMQVEKL